jgi:hypothetical protein
MNRHERKTIPRLDFYSRDMESRRDIMLQLINPPTQPPNKPNLLEKLIAALLRRLKWQTD